MPPAPMKAELRIPLSRHKLHAQLKRRIPLLNITSVVIRLTLFILLFVFSFVYATSSPRVYHDVLVWSKNSSLPYNVTVYRNDTAYTDYSIPRILHRTYVGWFLWNSTVSPGCERDNCKDMRWGCGGGEYWVAGRIGYADSLGFEGRMYGGAGDLVVLGMVVGVGFFAIGHSLATLCHAIEPSGIGFFKYAASMDLVLAFAFLALGLLPPYFVSKDLNEQNPFLFDGEIRSLVVEELDEAQRIACAMGFTCWILYTAIFILDVLLIISLNESKTIAIRGQTPASITTIAASTTTTTGNSSGSSVSLGVASALGSRSVSTGYQSSIVSSETSSRSRVILLSAVV